MARKRGLRTGHRAPSVFIGVPGKSWDADFGTSLLFMCLRMAANGIPHSIYSARGTILPQIRHKIVKAALEEKADYLLFVDTDQTFPPDMVERLLARDKAVIAANVATKQFPSTPTARRKGGHEHYGLPIYTHDRSPPLERCWRVGTGVMLIRLSIFDHPGLREPPWFQIEYIPELDNDRGEDWFFCEKLEAAGIPIWIDHELSLEVGHRGTITFDHTMVPCPREEYDGAAAGFSATGTAVNEVGGDPAGPQDLDGPKGGIDESPAASCISRSAGAQPSDLRSEPGGEDTLRLETQDYGPEPIPDGASGTGNAGRDFSSGEGRTFGPPPDEPGVGVERGSQGSASPATIPLRRVQPLAEAVGNNVNPVGESERRGEYLHLGGHPNSARETLRGGS